MSGAAADPFPPARSPDGRILVRYDPHEVRMSLWLMPPTVIRTRDDHEVVTVESPWSCDEAAFPERDRVLLRLRRYPDGETAVGVVVDVEAETWWPEGRPSEQRPVRTLPAALDAARGPLPPLQP